MNEQLHNPPWVNEWIVEQAKRHRIDGALLLVPSGSRPSATGTFFTERALEAAGIPTLQIWTDMVDARMWNGEEMRARVTDFIEQRLHKN
jgi:benzoyl-CoA reductase/2-hydroxyglutaryl-CoA dehydratase subunit BcrC/BadD/HgdB